MRHLEAKNDFLKLFKLGVGKKKKMTAEKFLAYAEQKQKSVIHGKKDRPIGN